jgi:uncharacterized OB-fold protein
VNAEHAPMPVLRRAGARPFPPRVSAFTRPFWDALAEGRLVTTGCKACGRLSFPPKPLCRDCWSEDVAWRPLTPHGRLYSFTQVHVLPRAFQEDGLGSIGIIDLADGVRLMCRLLAGPAQHRCEAPVEMVALAYDDGPLFAARPVE